jgi:hypothetical protein
VNRVSFVLVQLICYLDPFSSASHTNHTVAKETWRFGGVNCGHTRGMVSTGISKHAQTFSKSDRYVSFSSSSSSSKVCPLYIGFPSLKTKFRHLSLSLVSSSLSPWFVMLRLTPSIHRSLGLPLLRVPSGSHSKIFSGSLFPGILFTCPNHRSRFSSIAILLKCSSAPP